MADEEKILQHLGCSVGSIGVVDLSIPIIVDYAAACLSDFVCGANEEGKHLTGVNWGRDTSNIVAADLRNVVGNFVFEAPLPPSPPSGPPNSINFSLLMLAEPGPPSPAFTKIFT
jgi:hypothetical protein